MALKPIDEMHALQIQAGVLGRRHGHIFEERIAREINDIRYPFQDRSAMDGHVFQGDPAVLLLSFIADRFKKAGVKRATAISTGALATLEQGKKWLEVNGAKVSRCKSDLIINVEWVNGSKSTVGVSTKQCNAAKPTNAQLYFTTAEGFSNLLGKAGLRVSGNAVKALKQFCGDAGFRPKDDPFTRAGRKADPRRWFWEEINSRGRQEWETLLAQEQATISRLLLQKAYLDDRFSPDFLLHKTKRAGAWKTTEVAIHGISDLVKLSCDYGGFEKKLYSVHKGRHKDPPGTLHEAPRFGIIQMQRGGQAQHPTQLQFNLRAGYFYRI